MRRKRFISVFCLILALTLLFTACNQSVKTSSSKVASTVSGVPPVETPATLSMLLDLNPGVPFNTFSEIMTNFQAKHPTIKVNVIDPGDANYLSVVNVKMAAGDLPDVMDETGRSNSFYDPYNLDLRNEPWASEVVSNMLPIITNPQTGKLEGLPMSQTLLGITFNKDILSKYGIDPTTTLKTDTGLFNDIKIIKQKSNNTVTGFYVGGADGSPMGNMFSYFATPYFCSPKNNSITTLENGTFDWNKWAAFATMVDQLFKDGYTNSDYLTAKGVGKAAYYAQGKATFDFGFSSVSGIEALNSKINLGYQPLPTYWTGDTPSWAGGERDLFGIYNQSKNIDDSRILLDYLAEPMNIELQCEAEMQPAGLTGITVTGFDMTMINSYNAREFGVFDRIYLPNGLYAFLNKDGQEMAAGQITAQQYADDMGSNYKRLIAAASSST